MVKALSKCKRTRFNEYFTASYVIKNKTSWCFIPMNISNIRLLQRISKVDKSSIENSSVEGYSEHAAVKEYYCAQEELWNWNHDFWLQNNTIYEEKRRLQSHKHAGNSDLVNEQEELTNFYKNYLNERREAFGKYHIMWCKKNIHLLFLAIKAISGEGMQYFYSCIQGPAYKRNAFNK